MHDHNRTQCCLASWQHVWLLCLIETWNNNTIIFILISSLFIWVFSIRDTCVLFYFILPYFFLFSVTFCIPVHCLDCGIHSEPWRPDLKEPFTVFVMNQYYLPWQKLSLTNSYWLIFVFLMTDEGMFNYRYCFQFQWKTVEVLAADLNVCCVFLINFLINIRNGLKD